MRRSVRQFAGVAVVAAVVSALSRRARRRADLRAMTRAAVPPPLLPGYSVVAPGVGEFFVRDSARGDAQRPVVLLLHGLGATADINFFRAYDALSAEHRVIAMDLRGHGRGLRESSAFQLEACADDAAAVLDAVGVERAVVVGYSMGGPVALLLAARHPSRVAGLVLEATAAEFHDSTAERLMWRSLPLAETLARFGLGDRITQRVLRETVAHDPALQPYRDWLAGEFHRGYPPAMFEAGQALGRFDAREFVGDLNVPAAVVVTTRDRLVAPSRQRALAAMLDATVLEVDADHNFAVTGGDAFGRMTCLAVSAVTPVSGLSPAMLGASDRRTL